MIERISMYLITLKRALSNLMLALLMLITHGLVLAVEKPITGSEKFNKNVILVADYGLRFSCASAQLDVIKTDMNKYLLVLGVSPDLVVSKLNHRNGTLLFSLNTPKDDLDSLNLEARPAFKIHDEIVYLPTKNGQLQRVTTVSKKEILLAMLQHGRLTEISGVNCSLDAVKEQIGIRQNIVAWAENLNWEWPDGEAAKWHKKYWRRGTPIPNVALHKAFNDIFMNQSKYSIGCYTAAKIVMAHGVLDYFQRVQKDLAKQKIIKAKLLSLDQEPLVDVEPAKMWSFEKDFDPRESNHPGKILQIQYGVAPKNFVPGDWAYLVNTDPITSQKTGYEGSNAIYLGRNKFADFYNDHQHAYSYLQKLDEVYQWRHGVFNRHRDAAKIQPRSNEQFEQLGKTPSEGGLVHDFRVFPEFY